MSLVAALIYWVIISLWLAVLTAVGVAFVRNPRTFGAARLLLSVIVIDTVRNIIENLYFGLYFGGQYGLFPAAIVGALGNPTYLILPKVMNVIAASAVLGLLVLRWLPQASKERAEVDAAVHEKTVALNREAEERRHLFETSLDLILVTDRRGMLTRVSPSALAIVGYQPGEMTGHNAAEFIYEADLEATRNEMRLARKGRQTRNFETRYVHKDGRTIPLTWSGVWSEPEQKHFFFGRDMTERKAAEKNLERTRAFFNSIIESLPAMLLVKAAADGKVVLVNSAAEELLGYDRGEIIGKTATELFPLQDAQSILRQDAQALALGRAVEDEYTLTTRKMGVRRLRMKRFPLLNEQETEQYVVAFAEDVTAQRETEDQLFQAQKMEAIGHLTGGLAHDFNNLLAVIIGNLDVMAELGSSTPEQADLSSAALEAALSGAELTRRLLAFARRQPLQPEEVDANTLVSGITKLLGRTLGEDIKITLDLDPATKPIFVDRVQLETAITNLANNARDAMPAGGQLIIATRNGHLDQDYIDKHAEVDAGEYVVIEISDTGLGMSPEVTERIFEPFYTTKGVGKGTGLGLSMVFGFLKQSAGHISVYSEPGLGTTFRLYLQPSQLRSQNMVVEAPPLQPSYKNEETVLVVEDNASLRAVVVRQLKAIGLRVLEAENAQIALNMLKDDPKIDLIFTDVVLPGDMDGYTLARTINEDHPHAKIIMTSGFPGMRFKDTELAKSLPLLSKPYRKQDLVRMVREVLHERAQRVS
ncbi:MAG TPA: PAS domain S-box protein [Bradyrhizobium sp.]|uniref:hybrid sensor histidine kinase/response regulator n=1 Tax=Bradyrhizobium sp. TaxID=376 RepID=UPI002B48B992|nr:PAS domain S-box protein [Bradyrhizobium sp.]HKO70726.1 PAS domain S-box protein [Bradyrhizobium sp.]